MIKRTIDILLATLAIVALSPLLLPIMLALRLTGEGEVFYRQERIARFGRPFGILKFATMLKDSPNLPGGDISSHGDPRILPLGRFLRSTKINELPQLINIVVGHMSIIGPRPLTRRIVELFPPAQAEAIGDLRPGLSGVGSIVFRDEEMLLANLPDRWAVYRDTIVPYKATLERWYAERQNALLDVKLIYLTFLAVIRPKTDVARFLHGLPPPPADLVELRRHQTAARDNP